MDAAVEDPLTRKLLQAAPSIERRLLEWRRDIHAHPELANCELRTSALVAEEVDRPFASRVRIARGYPATVNHAGLTRWSLPRLARVNGAQRVRKVPKLLGGEDFSYYQQRVPGLFFLVGVTPPGRDPREAAPNHSPRFFVDEAGLLPGLRSLLALAPGYLAAAPSF